MAATASGSDAAPRDAPFARTAPLRRSLGPGDTIDEAHRRTSPEARANWCSRLTMSWLSPIIERGMVAPLQLDDLWLVTPGDTARTVSARFAANFAKHGSVVRSMVYQFPGLMWLSVFLRLVSNALSVVPALLLALLLEHLEQASAGVPAAERVWGEYGAWLLAGTMALCQAAKTLFIQHFYHVQTRLGMIARVAITTAVYRKSLRLSPAARQVSTVGDILTLMQNDAMRLEQLPFSFHHVWACTIEVAGYMTALIMFLGPSALVGLAVLLLLVPAQGAVMMRLGHYRERIVGHTTARIRIENECLQAMRAIKMYNWQDAFVSLVGGERNAELQTIAGSANLNAANAAFLMSAPAFVAAASLLVYSVTGGDMKPHIVFTALALFGYLRLPLLLIPKSAAGVAEAMVSAARLDAFLSAAEVDHAALPDDPSSSWKAAAVPVAVDAPPVPDAPATRAGANSSPSVTGGAKAAGDIVMVSATWHWGVADDAEPTVALHDVSFRVAKGELVAVVGPVGVGKSALCSAVLGDLHRASGMAQTRGSVAYVAQSAWIVNDTLKANILFGSPYDKRKYRRIVKACQLEPDLRMLPNADETEIGERGINLSGGQKQRVSVARALYSDADIYVLDSPLSALDAEVGKALFEQAVLTLLRDKTVLLSTNQLHLLPQTDRVIVLSSRGADEDGARISEMDSYETLVSHGLDFAETMRAFAGNHSGDDAGGAGAGASGADRSGEVGEPSGSTGVFTDDESSVVRRRQGSDASTLSVPKRVRAISGDSASAKENQAAGRLTGNEERSVGAVEWHVWWSYFKEGGIMFAFGVLLLFMATQGAMLISNLWVVWWTQDADYVSRSQLFWMGGYVISGFVLAVLAFARQYGLVWLGVKASTRLHESLLLRLLAAPMSFFDTTPTGRIISRFAKDTDMVDTALPNSLSLGLFILFLVIGAVVGITLEAPWFLVGIVPIALLYLHYLKLYRQVSRELKRLDSITRSPVYAHFSETLGGISTIRAFGATARFTETHFQTVDCNDMAFFLMRNADRWLGVRVELLGVGIALAAALLSAENVIAGNIGAAEAGFAITLALGITDLLAYSVRMFVEVENQLNAVERILFYAEQTPQEAPAHAEGNGGSTSAGVVANANEYVALSGRRVTLVEPPPEWPSVGNVTVEGLRMRYREDTPLVLRGVNLDIRGGEHIGVVGRTGSGKSSLLLCLFRIVEACEGSISIDGVDIATVGLSRLRGALGVIPQDPVLFSGSLRFNVDPTGQWTDAEAWEAIRRVGLEAAVLAQATANEDEDGSDASDRGGGGGGGGKSGGVGKAQGKGEVNVASKTAPVRSTGASRRALLAATSSRAEIAALGLDAHVAEYGENFSQGERQLICLARVMLRRSKVLLLDEATSHVDYQTDQLIGRVIREHFADSTVITVAHRLHTLADSSRILVMDNGKVAEFDSAHTLLEDEGSVFSGLVRELGPRAEAQLKAAVAGRASARAMRLAEVDFDDVVFADVPGDGTGGVSVADIDAATT